jgi:magnesium chelatase family protein
MTFTRSIRNNKIHSVAGKTKEAGLIKDRFLSVHITAQCGIVGGGSYPQPGEISLAHNGVLF